jgi:catabolite regulation protein CreA
VRDLQKHSLVPIAFASTVAKGSGKRTLDAVAFPLEKRRKNEEG